MEEREFKASHLFRTLGNPFRLRIVKALSGGPMTPTGLAARFRRRITNVSQHLKVLRDADVVWYRKVENEVRYELKNRKVLGIIASGEKFAQSRGMGPDGVRGKRKKT